MQKLGKKAKVLIILSCYIAGLLLFFLLMLLLRKNQKIADAWTNGFTRAWVGFFGRISSVLPFSLIEWLAVFAVLAIAALIVILIILLVKKRFFRALTLFLCFVIALVSVIDVYYMTAGFAYYRSDTMVPQTEKEYTAQMAAEAAEYFLDDYIYLSKKLPRDQNGCVVSPYTIRETARLLQKEFERINDGYLFEYTPAAKSFANSWYLSMMRLMGISFMPTGEANVNAQMISADIPHTMAHELAHVKGVMREEEANLTASYLLISSTDEYLRYCGYYSTFDSIMTAVYISNLDTTRYYELTARIPQEIDAEKQHGYKIWTRYDNIFDRISRFVNDLYLRIVGGAEDGTGSYGDKWDVDIIPDPDYNPNLPDAPPEPPLIINKVDYAKSHKMFFYLYETLNGNTEA